MSLASIPARPIDTLASPAAPSTLYKDEAVRNTSRRFAGWTAVCSHIIPLNRKICNLVAPVRDTSDTPRGQLLLATDDRGRPALLMTLAEPIAVARPATLSLEAPTRVKSQTVRAAYERAVAPVLCDAGCKYIFRAEPALLFGLNAGAPLRIRVGVPQGVDAATAFDLPQVVTTEFTVDGHGFSEALRDSLH